MSELVKLLCIKHIRALNAKISLNPAQVSVGSVCASMENLHNTWIGEQLFSKQLLTDICFLSLIHALENSQDVEHNSRNFGGLCSCVFAFGIENLVFLEIADLQQTNLTLVALVSVFNVNSDDWLCGQLARYKMHHVVDTRN